MAEIYLFFALLKRADNLTVNISAPNGKDLRAMAA
jgi:dihydroorotate dehydrogenase